MQWCNVGFDFGIRSSFSPVWLVACMQATCATGARLSIYDDSTAKQNWKHGLVKNKDELGLTKTAYTLSRAPVDFFYTKVGSPCRCIASAIRIVAHRQN